MKQFIQGLAVGIVLTISVSMVYAVNIIVDEITVKDMYFASAIIGQGKDPNVNQAWYIANKMIQIRNK